MKNKEKYSSDGFNESKRLLLSKPEVFNAYFLSQLITPKISSFLASWPSPYPENSLRERITRKIEMIHLGISHTKVIRLGSTEEIVGWIDISKSDSYKEIGELGFWIGEKYWGNGYMTELLPLFINDSFRVLDISGVEAVVQEHNFASIFLVKRVGMKKKENRVVFSASRKRHENWLVFGKELT